METLLDIPENLIYEEFDGKLIYRKGYKDFILGLKTEDEAMGTSKLQWFIQSAILRYLYSILPPIKYQIATGEAGIHISHGVNLSNDIMIYREGQIEVRSSDTDYVDVPPAVSIEVDIKIEESDFFTSENDYFQKKTERLLKFGVEKVVWVSSATQRILIATELDRLEIIKWDKNFEIIDGNQLNLWQLMLQNGFKE